MRQSWYSAICLFCACLLPTIVRAENYAFLVAVQDYDVKDLKPLSFTRNDIQEFAILLRQSGFQARNIVVLTDKADDRRFIAEAEKIRKQFDLLLAGLEADDTLIVAFSGHGIQFEGEEKNYYCPADADLEDPKHARLIPIDEIYERLKQCPAEKKLLLVDACRNDPLSPVKKARQTIRLKSVTRPQSEPVPKGVVALFSCAAGQESYEWPDLKHGVFFHHVLTGWQGAAAKGKTQITLDDLVAYAKVETQSFARLKLNAPQTPQLRSEFEGTWILRQLGSSEKSRPSSAGSLVPIKPLTTTGGIESDKEHTNSLGMKLRLIPAGEFAMGSPNSDRDAQPAEKPQHKVRISKPFYLGKYEVTQGEWKAEMKTEPWKGRDSIREGDEFPAAHISWNDAVAFCASLSRKEGRLYRLPTEAEWEYACRGERNTRFSFGDDEASFGEYGWVGQREKYAQRVGTKRPNSFGLHDMHGNLWEWCQDWYDEKYYTSSAESDPQGPEDTSQRVLRGGGWDGMKRGCRCANRAWNPPTLRRFCFGFRVVLTSPERTENSTPLSLNSGKLTTARTLETPAEKKEKRAVAKLRLAQQFLSQGKVDSARRWLEDLIKEYPDTQAAKEAKRQLDSVK